MNHLKIAFVLESLISGGAERVCVNLADYLDSYGYKVTIYIKNDSVPTIYTLPSGVNIRYVDYPRAKSKKIKIFISLIKYQRSLRTMLLTDRPDIIISFGTIMNLAVIPIARRINIPIIASEHNSHIYVNSIYRFLRLLIYRYANCITLLTQYDYNYYRRFLSNITVMHNPVVMSHSIHDVRRDSIILAVGDLTRYYIKGFDRLIRCFSSVAEKNWRLIIAGYGDNTPLSKLVNELGIDDKVQFVGEVKNISDYYDKAEIFALSSRKEGLPMVLIEAMNHGCACISFNCVSGPSEIITDKVDGLLIDDDDCQSFQQGLRELMNNEDLRLKIGRAAVSKSKQFSIEHIGPQWITLINQFVK
jgi:GalNAc-alpha-(1->4)-GalNAc-alpha-(1->3)-diNAcBac-PP-undecaprenol alpha-1,4-N-acetyl-D-galactosaminyltransferase